VLRDAMAVDSLDSCGVYFGTERFKTIAIKGGSKPKIKPTPRLVENTAANIQLLDRSLMSMRSAAHVGPQGRL
jgi:hypothetical protein